MLVILSPTVRDQQVITYIFVKTYAEISLSKFLFSPFSIEFSFYLILNFIEEKYSYTTVLFL